MTTMTTSPPERSLEDRVAIAGVLVAWAAHRDAGRWDDLTGLFTPDATVELTWVSATAAEFVEAARRQADGPLRAKHLITPPHADIRGDRAITETSAVLLTDYVGLDLGAVTYARFLDRLTRTDAGWRIAHRVSVYDAGSFTFPFGPVAVDGALARRFPREYAPLAYLLAHAGHEPSTDSPTSNSAREAAVRAEDTAWLHESDR